MSKYQQDSATFLTEILKKTKTAKNGNFLDMFKKFYKFKGNELY